LTHPPHPRVRSGLISLFLALLAVALIGAACAPATLPAPTATSAPTPVIAQPMAPTRPAATLAPVQQGKKIDLPMGVDADGNFYRGDLKAPVKLVEFSDFQ
jgi:protein-disulfide isomerase